MSAGKLKVKFSNEVDSGLRHRLLSEIQKATYINDNGNVSWSDHDIEQYIAVLNDAYTFPEELSRRERGEAVWTGIFNARKKDKLTDNSVIEEIQRFSDGKLAEPTRHFSMWSRLSYRPATSQRDKKFSYGDVNLRLCANLPRYMRIREEDLFYLTPIKTKDKSGFGFLIATTHARNETHAADKMFDASDMFQAMYNLALKPWNIIGSEQRPETTLQMGPYHFLYRERQSLLDKSKWYYNQNFRDEYWNSTSSESQKIFNVAPKIKSALVKLESHPLKKSLSSVLLMMNDGMEAANMSQRTLRYWTALERLFQDHNEKTTYKKIIQRATYLDDPADLARAKLHRLMRIRNKYIHMGIADNEHHQLTQYLAEHIKTHLFYLLFNGDDFKEHSEFIDMTDLPSDPESLQRRRRAIERRERMIEKRRHRDD